MIAYDFPTFIIWFVRQPGGAHIANALNANQLHQLHDICNAFHTEVELEQARMARETAARKNAADAVAAEVEIREVKRRIVESMMQRIL